MTAYFVTGTDTDVGKTVVSALLTRQLGAYYWKPIQSGTSESEDRLSVQQYAGIPDHKILPCAYEFQAPLSPHEAAALEGQRIDVASLIRPNVEGPLVIEGAGGLMVPLNEDVLFIDIMADLCDSVILVARTTLGTINHTLLSIEALRQRNIPLKGVILSGPERPNNLEAIKRYGNIDILGWVPECQNKKFSMLDINLFTL